MNRYRPAAIGTLCRLASEWPITTSRIAKYLAILLVVIGHSLANLQSVPMAAGLYLFIYMFHMPLFIVITGYFSRNWSFSPGKARKLITNVGVPYVVFEFAYSIYDWLAG